VRIELLTARIVQIDAGVSASAVIVLTPTGTVATVVMAPVVMPISVAGATVIAVVRHDDASAEQRGDE